MKTFIPDGYKSLLSVYDTQMAIGLLHRLFEDNLSAAKQSYHSYLGAYAYGHDPNTDYVQVAITDNNGVDCAERVVWRNDWEPEVEVVAEV